MLLHRKIVCFFPFLCCSLSYERTTIDSSIFLLMDNWGSFHLEAILNKAAMNIHPFGEQRSHFCRAHSQEL